MADGLIVWLTGHSGCGKTTLARLLADELQKRNRTAVRLDSDTLPQAIIKPQAATWEDRQRLKNENLIFLSKLLAQQGCIVLIASVGRYARWRDELRQASPHFVEIWLDCPLDIRLQRDTGGKYERHVGYYHFYEQPRNPDLILATDRMPPEQCVQEAVRLLQDRGFIG